MSTRTPTSWSWRRQPEARRTSCWVTSSVLEPEVRRGRWLSIRSVSETVHDHNPINSVLSDDRITSEHRSLMETAYAYGSKYQFILITGGPVLKYLGWVFLVEIEQIQIKRWFFYKKYSPQSFALCLYCSVELSHSSRVWFLHCRVHSGSTTPVTSERCPLTSMPKPLSTLNLHSFLQLMEAPLVVSRMETEIHW